MDLAPSLPGPFVCNNVKLKVIKKSLILTFNVAIFYKVINNVKPVFSASGTYEPIVTLVTLCNVYPSYPTNVILFKTSKRFNETDIYFFVLSHWKVSNVLSNNEKSTDFYNNNTKLYKNVYRKLIKAFTSINT